MHVHRNVMRGSVLAHRIPRAENWNATAGCALWLGIALALFGGGICWLSLHNDDRGVPLIVGGGFALVGLFLVYSGIHQRLAMRSKETIFEIDDLPLERGRTRAGLVIQEGPVHLQSLRVNLVCLETTTKIVRRKGRDETDRTLQQIWDTNVLDLGAMEIHEGERLQWEVELAVPANAKVTGKHGEWKSVEWRVEVWGRVRRRADFMHPFVVEVR